MTIASSVPPDAAAPFAAGVAARLHQPHTRSRITCSACTAGSEDRGMALAAADGVRLVHRLLAQLAQLARRGHGSAPPEPPRPRAVLLQIDGLSSRRLREALGRGDMPHLARWLESGAARLETIVAATPPSTPVFQAGLLYGERAEVPGFGWFDRALGRTVRMDLAEDVTEIERSIHARASGRPLLGRGVSYGTIWPGGAAQAFFNVVLFVHGKAAAGSHRIVRNLYDRLLSAGFGAAIAGRVLARFVLELGVGLWDFQRWCRRVGSTRFEWRFLYMRLFVSVVMRDISTQGVILDILRGVPVIYLDFLGYDEYAHRRGPDAEMALYNLRGIDAAIARIERAVRAVPEYGYEIFVFSDHGQSATTPFVHVTGRDLHRFVLEHAAGCVGGSVEDSVIRELVALRETELWVRALWRPLRAPMALYVAWLERRLGRRLAGRTCPPAGREALGLDGIEVVTGGTIAHLYFGRRERGVRRIEEIERRWPLLLGALRASPAIGLMVGQSEAGPVVFHRGARHLLADRRALEPLPPFRALGYELLRAHLEEAVLGRRSGDLVLYGAFAEAGEVAFDFEFGSHGGVSPEELDQFVLCPAGVSLPFSGAVRAEEFYRFFHTRYGCHDEDDRLQADAA